MGKKRASQSKHIKTRHKKVNKHKRILSEPVVNPAIKDINKVITEQIKIEPKPKIKEDNN